MSGYYSHDPEEHAEADEQLAAAQATLDRAETQIAELEERAAAHHSAADLLESTFAREALSSAAPRHDLWVGAQVNRAAAVVCDQRVNELESSLRSLRGDVNKAMLEVQKQEDKQRRAAQLKAAPGGVLVRVGNEMRSVKPRQ